MVLRYKHDVFRCMRPTDPNWRVSYLPGALYRHRIPPLALSIPLTLAEHSVSLPLPSRHHRARLPASK